MHLFLQLALQCVFFQLNFLKVVSISRSHSQSVSTLSVLCVPSLSVVCNRSYFHPCLSVTVAAGWLNIYIFHSLVTFPCCRSGSSSLLAALLLTDYCLQISYGHSKWYTGSQGQRVQRLEEGGKREKENTKETVTRLTVSCLNESGKKRQRCWRSICICRDMAWSVILYLWYHCITVTVVSCQPRWSAINCLKRDVNLGFQKCLVPKKMHVCK